jgi:hypothetical protein
MRRRTELSILFVMAVSVAAIAGPTTDPVNGERASFTVDEIMTLDRGLGYTPLPPEINESCCVAICRQAGRGGCVLASVEEGEDEDGNRTCHCIYICMPALKWLI